jgi:hypothetical protein
MAIGWLLGYATAQRVFLHVCRSREKRFSISHLTSIPPLLLSDPLPPPSIYIRLRTNRTAHDRLEREREREQTPPPMWGAEGGAVTRCR